MDQQQSDENINLDDYENDFGQQPFDLDDVGPELDQIFSQGFTAPDDNDDPFQLQNYQTSFGNPDPENQFDEPITTIFPTPTNDNAINDEVEGSGDKQLSTSKKEERHKAKKQKQPVSKGKPFEVFRRVHSNASEEPIDPEEEKLKMLPDCCEFTVRRNDAFEVDEGRKDMSSAWFSQVKLIPAQQKNLCFSESLLMVEESGTVVGKYYTTITQSKWSDKPCLCVHSGSFGKFSTGLESGTSITSFINHSLHPLQEFVHEWCTLNSDTIERKTFLMTEGDHMPGKITLLRNGKLVDNKPINLGMKDRVNLVTEGSNLLVQRLISLERRTTGSMILQSLSHTGKVVRAKYAELGSGWENVKGKQMKTWGIRRTVNVSDDEERIWDSLLNKNARLILRCQPDSPQALIPLWFESIVEFDKNNNFIGSYAPYAWACDPELYSKYLVKKETAVHDHRRYLLDHPEIRALLSDYLQSILFRKPQNVIEFTKQYFEGFLDLRVRTPKSPHHLKKADRPSISSSYYDGSSYNTLESQSLVGAGEWLGEGEDGSDDDFYPVNPTINYDKADDTEEMDETDPLYISTTENETEDDLVVDENGEYVRSQPK